MNSRLRSLPSVERILGARKISELSASYSHDAVAGLVRLELDSARERVKAGAEAPDVEELVESVIGRVRRTLTAWPRRVINATGVILHTNLGRAPLSVAAAAAASEVAAGYTDLEMDIETGRRGSRQAHISSLLAQITGAEAGLVVNNNASALLLGLSAVAEGRSVIVSRGEAVEIGGGFRVPDVLRQSGARLVEVGTTNRTYVADYEAAIGPDTAVLLKVHQSNFAIRGFTHSADVEVLARLSGAMGLVTFHDLGSGALLDTSKYGLPREPMVQESVAQGADLSFFSGDKLLGGPQAGIVVGKKKHVDTLARHPLARAVRVEKITLAALSATLLSYARGTAEKDLPVWQMISANPADLKARAQTWKSGIEVKGTAIRSNRSTVGGGSLPDETLPTHVLALKPIGSVEAFVGRLRAAPYPVVARIEADEVLFDPRTVLQGEDGHLVDAIRSALAG